MSQPLADSTNKENFSGMHSLVEKQTKEIKAKETQFETLQDVYRREQHAHKNTRKNLQEAQMQVTELAERNEVLASLTESQEKELQVKRDQLLKLKAHVEKFQLALNEEKAENSELLQKMSGLENKINEMTQENEAKNASSNKLEARIQALEVSLATKVKTIAERDSDVVNLKAALAAKVDELEAYHSNSSEAAKASLATALENAKIKEAKIKDDAAAMQAEMITMMKDLEAARAEADANRAALEEITTSGATASARAAAQKERAVRELEEAQKELKEVRTAASDAEDAHQKKISELTHAAEEAIVRATRLEGELAKAKAFSIEIQEEATTRGSTEMANNVDTLTAEKMALEKRLAEANAALVNATKAKEKGDIQAAEKLTEMTEERDRLASAVEALTLHAEETLSLMSELEVRTARAEADLAAARAAEKAVHEELARSKEEIEAVTLAFKDASASADAAKRLVIVQAERDFAVKQIATITTESKKAMEVEAEARRIAEKEATTLLEECEALKARLKDVTERAEVAVTACNGLRTRAETAEGELALVQKEAGTLACERVAKLESDLKESEQARKDAIEELENTRVALAKLTKDRDAAAARHEKTMEEFQAVMEAEVTKAKAASDISIELKGRLKEAEDKAGARAENVNSLEAKLAAAEESIATLQETASMESERAMEAKSARAQLEQDKAAALASAVAAETRKVEAEKALKEVEEQMELMKASHAASVSAHEEKVLALVEERKKLGEVNARIVREAEVEKTQAAADLAALAAQLAELEQQQGEAEQKDASAARDAADRAGQAVDGLRVRMELKEKEVEAQTALIEQLTNELEETKFALAEATNTAMALAAKVEDGRIQLDAALAKLTNVEEDRVATLEVTEAINRQNIKMSNKLAEATKELAVTKEQIMAVKVTCTSLEERLAAAVTEKEEVEKLAEEVTAAQTVEVEMWRDRYNQENMERWTLKNRLQELEDELASFKNIDVDDEVEAFVNGVRDELSGGVKVQETSFQKHSDLDLLSNLDITKKVNESDDDMDKFLAGLESP